MKNDNQIKKILKEPTDIIIGSEILKKEELEILDKDQEIKLKKSICNWVKWIVSFYLFFVATILTFIILTNHNLSDIVLIALLSTTTINILGLPYIIIVSLFTKKLPKNLKVVA